MSYDTAEINIENALNYTYARSKRGENWYNESHDFSFTKSSTSSTLFATLINTIYDQILDSLKAIDLSYSSTITKQLTIVDVKIKYLSGVVNIDVDAMWGIAVVSAPEEEGDWSFDYPSGQGWHWANQQGYYTSATSSPQFVGTWGAPEKLTQYAQHNCWWNYTNALGYFTNVSSIFILNVATGPTVVEDFKNLVGESDNPYYTAEPTYIGNYSFYIDHSKSTYVMDYNGYQVYVAEVLPKYAMNYYTAKIVQFFTNIVPQTNWIPTGQSIYNFEVLSDFLPAIGDYDIWHNYKFNYGTFIENDIDPEPLNY